MAPPRRTSKDRISFTGTVEKFDGPYAWSYVEFPHDVQELFGRKGTVRILGTVNGVTMDRALMPTKSGIHVIVLGADLRKRAQVKVGDTVSLVLWRNPAPDAMDLPEALEETFDLLPEFKAKWEALRPGMKRSILIWLNSAKTAPTLGKRIAEMLRRSESGHAWFGNGQRASRFAAPEQSGDLSRTPILHPMRKLLLPLFCCLLSIASAQDPSLFLVPRWKVGDSRTLTINTVTTATENGTATEDREVLEVKARVVNEDAKSFILRLEYDNIVLRQADKLMKGTGCTSTPITKMNLRYAVDRITGEPTLQNWEEVQRVVKNSFEEVLTRMKAEQPDQASMFGMVMLPILKVFDSQENVQGYFSDVIDYITFPYGKQMVEGDTVRIEQYGRDPFGASVDSMHVTTLMSIQRIDRWEQQAVVRGELRYDIPSFMAQMKNMMQMVVSTMTDDPQAKKKAEAEMKQAFNAMRFDVRDERLYTVDLRTTWPISSVRTGRVVMKDHERSNETTVVTTVTVAR